MEYRPVVSSGQARAAYVALFAQCFPRAKPFTLDYLAWLYESNPEGAALGYDAWDGDRLAAHYVCIPGSALVNGQVQRTLLSLNTATHPEWQGRGLFTALAQRTYEAASAQGFASVYGVANANSTPGFVRKLGFQLVQPLDARVGMGSLGIDWEAVAAGRTFVRQRSIAALQWRMGRPGRPITARMLPANATLLQAPANPLFQARAELAACELPAATTSVHGVSTRLQLFLGALPSNTARFAGYVSVPQGLRPSPLNFIYRPLSGSGEHLEPGRLQLSFLDFDAY